MVSVPLSDGQPEGCNADDSGRSNAAVVPVV
jgi:hypothetical protein